MIYKGIYYDSGQLEEDKFSWFFKYYIITPSEYACPFTCTIHCFHSFHPPLLIKIINSEFKNCYIYLVHFSKIYLGRYDSLFFSQRTEFFEL